LQYIYKQMIKNLHMYTFTWWIVFGINVRTCGPSSWHCMMYSLQHYVIKFISHLQYVWITHVSSINKTDRHHVSEMLLTAALNTITLTLLWNGQGFWILTTGLT
jgi:hypothetical protein